MSKLTIIRGLPGSGKSTLAKKLKAPNDIHLEADMYFVVDGVYTFDPTKIREAHDWCRKSAKTFLNNGFNVIVSNTFTQSWEFQGYLDDATEIGADVTIYRCENDYGNIHNVPEASLKKMRDRFEDVPNEIRYKNEVI